MRRHGGGPNIIVIILFCSIAILDIIHSYSFNTLVVRWVEFQGKMNNEQASFCTYYNSYSIDRHADQFKRQFLSRALINAQLGTDSPIFNKNCQCNKQLCLYTYYGNNI